jgi:hypothetical protein
MRVMVIVRANKQSEAGEPPSEQLLEAMRAYNQQLADAGVLVSLGGLKPSVTGKRVTLRSGKRVYTDGPFAEAKEVIAGYAIWNVASMEEAMRWVERFPILEGEEEDIELRPMYDEGPCGTSYG